MEPILSPQLLADWRAAGGNAFVVKLVNQFVCDATACVEKIQVALDSKNANGVLEAAHGLNLKTAVGSRKSAQPLDAPRKCKNWLITQKVTTQFLNSLCTSIACTAFSRSTAAFRLKGMAANMGLTQLAKIAHQIETLGRHHNLLDGPPLFDSVQQEFARVQDGLLNVLNQEELHSN